LIAPQNFSSILGGLYLLLCNVTASSHPHNISSCLYWFLYQKKKSFLTLTVLSYTLKHEIWVIFAYYATAVAGPKLRVPYTALAYAFLLLWKKQR